MAIDFTKTRERLKEFDFHRLFVEELGWSQPATKVPTEMKVEWCRVRSSPDFPTGRYSGFRSDGASWRNSRC